MFPANAVAPVAERHELAALLVGGDEEGPPARPRRVAPRPLWPRLAARWNAAASSRT